MAVHNIVIVGGSFGGLGVAHVLLRHTIPKLEASNTGQTYKVTLISTTSQFLYKIAAPRTVANPDLIPVSQILIPIADGFKDYPSDHFEHVIGTATSVDEENKTVTVKRSDGSTVGVSYNSIVCATGSTYKSPLWTLQDDPKQSIDEFQRFHQRIPKAESILVVGGGPAGVETAGRFSPYSYLQKKLTPRRRTRIRTPQPHHHHSQRHNAPPLPPQARHRCHRRNLPLQPRRQNHAQPPRHLLPATRPANSRHPLRRLTPDRRRLHRRHRRHAQCRLDPHLLAHIQQTRPRRQHHVTKFDSRRLCDWRYRILQPGRGA